MKNNRPGFAPDPEAVQHAELDSVAVTRGRFDGGRQEDCRTH